MNQYQSAGHKAEDFPQETQAAVKAWKPLLDSMDIATKVMVLKAFRKAVKSKAMTFEMASLSVALMKDPAVKQALDL